MSRPGWGSSSARRPEEPVTGFSSGLDFPPSAEERSGPLEALHFARHFLLGPAPTGRGLERCPQPKPTPLRGTATTRFRRTFGFDQGASCAWTEGRSESIEGF